MAFPEDPIETFHQGQQVTLFVDFADKAGDPADPDVVLLRLIEGDTAETAVDVLQASLTNPSVGRWEYDLTIPKDGDKALKPWTYRFEGTSAPGGVTAADERRFEVAPSPFYPPTS